jgi:hypothetical protein
MIAGKRLPLLALAAFLFAPAPVQAQAPSEWSWFRAASAANDWWITRGRADVSISGSAFTATLWEGNAQSFARLALKGTLRGARVQVKVTINNSDQDPFYLTGHLKRTCWDLNSGREELVLTDGSEVIGLFREIHGSHCTAIK